MYLLYIFPPELHTRLRCYDFFNPSKKNSFGCAANRNIEKAEDLPAPLCIALNITMMENNELERVWKEPFPALIEVLSRNLPGGTE
jgi:hypothetical protein